MRLWICTCCGNAERLTIWPDCCSVCGGSMETQDGRHTSVANDCDWDTAHYEAMEAAFVDDAEADDTGMAWVGQAIADFEAEMEAATAGVGEVVRIWHSGTELHLHQRAIVDHVLTLNRIDMLEAIYTAA